MEVISSQRNIGNTFLTWLNLERTSKYSLFAYLVMFRQRYRPLVITLGVTPGSPGTGNREPFFGLLN